MHHAATALPQLPAQHEPTKLHRGSPERDQRPGGMHCLPLQIASANRSVCSTLRNQHAGAGFTRRGTSHLRDKPGGDTGPTRLKQTTHHSRPCVTQTTKPTTWCCDNRMVACDDRRHTCLPLMLSIARSTASGVAGAVS